MIFPPELRSVLYGHHIANVFYHAHLAIVSIGVRADIAARTVRNIVTGIAKLDLTSQGREFVCQAVGLTLRLFQ